MRQSCLIWLSFVFLSLNSAQADKFKLYHCQSLNGPVVVQDRPCTVTRLKSVKPSQQKSEPRQILSGNRSKQRPKTPGQATLSSDKEVSSQAFLNNIKNKHWPARITPNNHGWQVTIDVPGHQNKNKTGKISVDYYKNPDVTLNKDAFSYALNLYHGIRHQYRLIDSQFKSHPAYKIFNIVYHKADQSAQSEFYVSKLDGSLWVFTLESRPISLAKTRQIMAQLQELL